MPVTISPNNTKLGNIPSFSTPSIASCPARTALCSKMCYAQKVERIYKAVGQSYDRNFQATDDVDFVAQMVSALTKLASKKKKPMTTFRWHVSGDISSVKYLYDMIKVMQALPNITFYAYTRNWTLKNWMSHLETLRQLPNFTLFASLDDEHIQLNLVPPSDWRIAYVGEKSLDEINNYLNLNKKIIVCPNQKHNSKVLCDGCSYCFNPKFKGSNRAVYFIKH